ncbi:glutamate synthase precursor, partial [Vibrio coralliirubri]
MALYDPSLEKDNCGFGLIAQMEGQPSHKLVRTAISALDRMTHRGGIAADGKTGDGCGLLLQKPDSYLRIIAEENNFKLGKQYAVGMIFFSQDPIKAQSAQDIVNKELAQETLTVAGWRVVPTNTDVLGPIAKDSVPNIQQV